MKIQEIRIPQLGVNDEFIALVEWLVEDKAKVDIGDPICVVESSKATTELRAEGKGFLLHRSLPKEEIPIKTIIGYIVESPDISISDLEKRVEMINKDSKPSMIKIPLRLIRATKKAEELANLMGINLSDIKQMGIVREKDVQDHLKKRNNKTFNMVAIYGASLGGLTLKEAIEAAGIYKVVLFIDDNPEIGGNFAGLPVVIGESVEELRNRGIYQVACEIANSEFRIRLRDWLGGEGITLINVVHPTAIIAPSVKMGVGNFIKAGAIIETNTLIGDCCVIDNGATIAHDNVIGDGCHLAPGVSLGSGIEIGQKTIVGIGASISTKIKIGKRVIIGVGSSVVMDIPDDSIVEGVPGRIIGKRK